MLDIRYKTFEVDSLKIFYREAGPPSLPNLLLLHGHGSSSHVFQNLILLLSDSFHIIAPDYPGFGQSSMPSRDEYKYTFVNLANTIDKFTEVIGMADKGFAIYVFDYGAPIGFHIAVKHPVRITGIISQSGNAYDEGLAPDGFKPIRAYWAEPSNPERRKALKFIFTEDAVKWAYLLGIKNEDASLISPDSGTLDMYFNNRPGALDIQLDLLLDYESNVKAYPMWQKYLKEHKPKLVAIWGKEDAFFQPPGAEAYKRDLPDAYVEIIEGGHYLNDFVPEKVAEVAKKLLQ